MATAKIKSAYSLDVEAVQALEELARRQKVSKSEALTRAILKARESLPSEDEDALEALDELQASLRLTRRSATRWESEVRKERLASSDRGNG